MTQSNGNLRFNMSKIPQKQRVLEKLRDAKGEWISGRYFAQTMMLSQYHARIWELQNEGHEIEASEFTDEYNFKSYRLLPEGQLTLQTN